MAESIANTLIFPLSADPIGFNHFSAAEWILRQVPELERVTFVLSNGRHPDPTKKDAGVGPLQRLEICELAAAAVSDPTQSLLALRAKTAGTALCLLPQRIGLSTVEFEFDRAVRSAELVPLLRGERAPGKQRLHWFAGSDLLNRMIDPNIFSDEDLTFLSKNCRYHVLERKNNPVSQTLDLLRLRRGVVLSLDIHPLQGVPDWLAPFLELSSTLIRTAAEAGDPLGGLLPRPAAQAIAEDGLYRDAPRVEWRVDAAGNRLGGLSVLGQEVARLEAALAAEASALAKVLTALAAQGAPHTLGIVETSTGGEMTAALGRRSGASKYFRHSRFAYDEASKLKLLGGPVPGGSAVSEAAVRALAEAMREEAGTDYALAESGMAGPPDGSRRSLKYGLCWFACAAPGGTVSEALQLHPFHTRRQHQLTFAAHGLALLRRIASVKPT